MHTALATLALGPEAREADLERRHGRELFAVEFGEAGAAGGADGAGGERGGVGGGGCRCRLVFSLVVLVVLVGGVGDGRRCGWSSG